MNLESYALNVYMATKFYMTCLLFVKVSQFVKNVSIFNKYYKMRCLLQIATVHFMSITI